MPGCSEVVLIKPSAKTKTLIGFAWLPPPYGEAPAPIAQMLA